MAAAGVSWKRNFYTLWGAEVIAIIGFQAIQPFLPYYIQEFAVADLEEALIWSGHMGTAAGMAMALSSPVWGALADRYGRKPMVVRAMIGGGLTVLLMAYVSNVGQLLVARTLQGALAGTVTACITMVSTTTPRKHLGFALGMMQGAFMLGASVGPLIGGPFIRRWGYSDTLLGAGIVVVLAGVAVQLWVREDFVPQGAAGRIRFFEDARRVLAIRAFAVMLGCLTAVQFCFGVIMPVVPLFLQELAGRGDADEVLATAGLVFALGGLVGALSSALISKWSDRWGGGRVLVAGLAATGLFYVAQGAAEGVGLFAGLAIMSGLATGVIRPVANVMIARAVPEEDRGKAFGVMSSATAFGWSLGPVVGGYVGAHWGFRSVFWLTAVLFVLMALGVRRALHHLPETAPVEDSRKQALLGRLRQRSGRRSS